MKILFTRFPLESADGGAENQTQWLMEGLKAKGYAVSFLGSCPVILRRAAEAGMKHVKLDIGDPPVTKAGAVSFLWRKAAMKKALIRAIDALPEKPDVIFMLSLSEKLLMSEWATKQGINVFWIEHDRIGPWLERNPWLGTLKKASQHATIVCVSDVSRKLYVKMGFDSKKVVSIPNGVPPSPDPFPRGGKGGVAEEMHYKKPVHTTILKFAREMRKEPTPAEKLLWEKLRFDQLGVRFRRQHPINHRILDFYCHEVKLGIELDGEIHNDPDRQIYDKERTEVLADLEIKILRFKNEEILSDVQQVLRRIQEFLPSPPPSGEGLPARTYPFGTGGGVGSDIHVGTVARLDPEKGVDVLIQSIAELPEVTLSILGKGREESYIRALIDADTQRIGQERIHLLSHVPDLTAFYRSLDVFVLPSSDHDPFGLVAAEAMMCGIATIVTDACGVSGSINAPVEALVVPAGSPKELSIAIRTLFDVERRAELAEAGRKAAEKKFTIDLMVERYERILQK